MRSLLAVILIGLLIGPAAAQSPMTTMPFNTGAGGTVVTGGTLPVPGNLALAANGGRRGCVLQNQGTHNMSVGVSSGMAFPLILTPGQSLQCPDFVTVIGDPLYITGTAGDVFVVWWQ